MKEPRWLDRPEQEAWRAYLDSTRLLMQALDRQLTADAGLSFADYELLVRLSEAPDRRMRMSDLADVIQSTRSGATRAVARLESSGWVRRVGCASDKRGMHAALTDAGVAKLTAAAPGHVAAVREYMFDLLSTEQVESLQSASSAMREHLLRGS